MADGAHIMTPLNVDLTPGITTDWPDVRLDAHVTDLVTKTARRINDRRAPELADLLEGRPHGRPGTDD
ncbi:MAG: hypothetical protein ACRDRW_17120 [Pseudonocardiaceae bacterium]